MVATPLPVAVMSLLPVVEVAVEVVGVVVVTSALLATASDEAARVFAPLVLVEVVVVGVVVVTCESVPVASATA